VEGYVGSWHRLCKGIGDRMVHGVCQVGGAPIVEGGFVGVGERKGSGGPE
jgi:hypothetical protein